MSSTNDAVFHRRNKQIQEAIDGQNLKQALQLIEKRMKKGEVTRFLMVWTCFFISRCHHSVALACCCDEKTTTFNLI